jgi:hypothetical protein
MAGSRSIVDKDQVGVLTVNNLAKCPYSANYDKKGPVFSEPENRNSMRRNINAPLEKQAKQNF